MATFIRSLDIRQTVTDRVITPTLNKINSAKSYVVANLGNSILKGAGLGVASMAIPHMAKALFPMIPYAAPLPQTSNPTEALAIVLAGAVAYPAYAYTEISANAMWNITSTFFSKVYDKGSDAVNTVTPWIVGSAAFAATIKTASAFYFMIDTTKEANKTVSSLFSSNSTNTTSDLPFNGTNGTANLPINDTQFIPESVLDTARSRAFSVGLALLLTATAGVIINETLIAPNKKKMEKIWSENITKPLLDITIALKDQAKSIGSVIPLAAGAATAIATKNQLVSRLPDTTESSRKLIENAYWLKNTKIPGMIASSKEFAHSGTGKAALALVGVGAGLTALHYATPTLRAGYDKISNYLFPARPENDVQENADPEEVKEEKKAVDQDPAAEFKITLSDVTWDSLLRPVQFVFSFIAAPFKWVAAGCRSLISWIPFFGKTREKDPRERS